MEEKRVQFLVFAIYIGDFHIIINLHHWYLIWRTSKSNPYAMDAITISPQETKKLDVPYQEGHHQIDDSCTVHRKKRYWHEFKFLCFVITFYWMHRTRYYHIHPSKYHYKNNPIDWPKPTNADMMPFPS